MLQGIHIFGNLNIVKIIPEGRSDGYTGESELVVEKLALEQETQTLFKIAV